MEFNEKLQELRRQKGLTQEELAVALYVSRTAVSKWESGRGYPSIDSLKRIAGLFNITVDQLLSGDELLTIALEDNKERANNVRDLVFGLLDISVSLLLFLPLFAQRTDGAVLEVSLLSLTALSPYLKTIYIGFVCAIILFGILTLALQNLEARLWTQNKRTISLILTFLFALLLVLGLQPYATTLLLVFSIIKVFLLFKRQ